MGDDVLHSILRGLDTTHQRRTTAGTDLPISTTAGAGGSQPPSTSRGSRSSSAGRLGEDGTLGDRVAVPRSTRLMLPRGPPPKSEAAQKLFSKRKRERENRQKARKKKAPSCFAPPTSTSSSPSPATPVRKREGVRARLASSVKLPRPLAKKRGVEDEAAKLSSPPSPSLGGKRPPAGSSSREEILLQAARRKRRKESLVRVKMHATAKMQRELAEIRSRARAEEEAAAEESTLSLPDTEPQPLLQDGVGGNERVVEAAKEKVRHVELDLDKVPSLSTSNPFALLAGLEAEDVGKTVEQAGGVRGRDGEGGGRLPKGTEIIDNLRDCIRAAVDLAKAGTIAVDCEGCNFGRNGSLTLLQAATTSRVYLFDVLEGGADFFEIGGLRSLLESGDVTKVMHDCRGDSDALFHLYGVRLQAVFDTQIAYAILTRQDFSYTPLPAGLNTILRKFATPVIKGGNAHNTMKDTAKQAMIDNPTYWNTRPLSHAMVEYARQDVLHLCVVHREMRSRLAEKSRGFVATRSAEYVAKVRDLVDLSARQAVVDGRPQYGVETWDAHAKLSVRGTPRSRQGKGQRGGDRRAEDRRARKRKAIGGSGASQGVEQAAVLATVTEDSAVKRNGGAADGGHHSSAGVRGGAEGGLEPGRATRAQDGLNSGESTHADGGGWQQGRRRRGNRQKGI